MSCTVTVVGAVPLLLSNLIVYVIISPCFTSVPAGLASFEATTFGLFTVIFSVFVLVSFTVAVFEISFSNIFSANSSTVTSNERVVCPNAGTSTSIPSFNSSEVFVVSPLFIFILFATNVVPSGISSFIVALPARFPSFLAVIVYVIFSPSTT